MSEEFERDDEDILLEDKEDQRLEEPPKYSVVLLNDDYTPMDFVVDVLKKFFGKSHEVAEMLTLQIHQKGKCVAAVYSKDVAETKSQIVNEYCQNEGHPFHSAVEQA